MTHSNFAILTTKPGKRDELLDLLRRNRAHLPAAGCTLAEVGIRDGEPDKIYIMERWVSPEADAAAMELPATHAAWAEVGDMIIDRDEVQFTGLYSLLADDFNSPFSHSEHYQPEST